MIISRRYIKNIIKAIENDIENDCVNYKCAKKTGNDILLAVYETKLIQKCYYLSIFESMIC